MLTTAPVLKIEDPNKGFVVCTDTCNEGFGGVLTQEGHVIAYESRKLKTHEKNYASYDLELASIIHAMKMWRHHLIGKIFLLESDKGAHMKLVPLFSATIEIQNALLQCTYIMHMRY